MSLLHCCSFALKALLRQPFRANLPIPFLCTESRCLRPVLDNIFSSQAASDGVFRAGEYAAFKRG